MKRRLAAFVGSAVLAVGLSAIPAAAPELAAAKSCRAGYVHAVLPDGHKCLHSGEFCKRSYNRYYRHHHFYCPRSRHLRRS